MPLLKDGQVKKLREAKGWSQEMLANKAITSLKTISSIEKGAPARISTIGKLAKALGVPPSDLMEGGEPDAPQTQPVPLQGPKAQAQAEEDKCVEVILTIRLPFERFDETTGIDGILAFLAATIKAKQAIVESEIMPGSIVMILRMSEEDVETLVHAMMNCDLDMINVDELAVPQPDPEYRLAVTLDYDRPTAERRAEIERNFAMRFKDGWVIIRRKQETGQAGE